MIVLEDLKNASVNVESLQNFLSDNFEEIYDFLSLQKHSELISSRDKFNSYIQLNRSVILQLDITNYTNLAFLSLLLNICEELGLISAFGFLFNHIKKSTYNIGERLKASACYLIDVSSADEYLNRYEIILEHLKNSVKQEEDNIDKVLMTFVNYYAQVVNDFGQFNIDVINKLRLKISSSLTEVEFSFLNNKLIKDVLDVDVKDFDNAYKNIHLLIDTYLGRDIAQPNYKKEFLLETETNYCELLASANCSFVAIRELSVTEYQVIRSDTIFYSLGRGVTILTEESQLFAYMNSYGNMHYEKLIDAYIKLPNAFWRDEVNVIDWGCGQGLATMSLLDFRNKNGYQLPIKTITLIDPSEIALKRASLHIRKYETNIRIHTINKDLDAIIKTDFIRNKIKKYIHIFSNVIDINSFSLANLLKLIESTFIGVNYFICVSPYLNDTRTIRLDMFVKHFSNQPSFKLIESVENRSGEWKGNWTRVVRIFEVSL